MRLSLPVRRFGLWRVEIKDSDTHETLRTVFGFTKAGTLDRASAIASDIAQAYARQVKEYGI